MNEPKQSRRGWRSFFCECGTAWEDSTRDCYSASGETCPQCFEEVKPTASRLDLTLVCDKWGNLPKEELRRIDLARKVSLGE